MPSIISLTSAPAATLVSVLRGCTLWSDMAKEGSRQSRSPLAVLIVGLTVSVLLSIGSSYALGFYLRIGVGRSPWVVFALLASWFASFALAAVTIGAAVAVSFRAEATVRRQLPVILVAYLGATVVFTGVYFSMSLIGDMQYAAAHFFYYERYATTWRSQVEAGDIVVPPFENHQRAFTGIESMLYGTLDDSLPRGIEPYRRNPQKFRVSWASGQQLERVVVFKREAVPAVLLDCLHLSVMTITTVGYGNVAPQTWYARLATDVEALTGTALLAVALALLLARRR